MTYEHLPPCSSPSCEPQLSYVALQNYLDHTPLGPLTEGIVVLVLQWWSEDREESPGLLLAMGRSHQAFFWPCQLKQGEQEREGGLQWAHEGFPLPLPSINHTPNYVTIPIRRCICLTFQGRCTMALEKYAVKYGDWCLWREEQGTTIVNCLPMHAIVQISDR